MTLDQASPLDQVQRPPRESPGRRSQVPLLKNIATSFRDISRNLCLRTRVHVIAAT